VSQELCLQNQDETYGLAKMPLGHSSQFCIHFVGLQNCGKNLNNRLITVVDYIKLLTSNWIRHCQKIFCRTNRRFFKQTQRTYNKHMQDDAPQPGWTYKPGDEEGDEQVAEGQPTPEEASKIISEAAKTSEAVSNQEENTQSSSESVSWTASEFVANHKSVGWYIVFMLGLGLCGGLIYFLIHDLISVVVIGVAGLLFMILASRKPRQLTYKIDSQGVVIGDKFYPYNLFKSFGVGQEGVIGAIHLTPLKRFMPELSIYYPSDEEDKILDTLSEFLPHEKHEEAGVDRLLRKMRF